MATNKYEETLYLWSRFVKASETLCMKDRPGFSTSVMLHGFTGSGSGPLQFSVNFFMLLMLLKGLKITDSHVFRLKTSIFTLIIHVVQLLRFGGGR